MIFATVDLELHFQQSIERHRGIISYFMLPRVFGIATGISSIPELQLSEFRTTLMLPCCMAVASVKQRMLTALHFLFKLFSHFKFSWLFVKSSKMKINVSSVNFLLSLSQLSHLYSFSKSRTFVILLLKATS